ncbi:hypothetical protein CKO15_00075 [Halorhodospira abdelmalekii]|nr:hypothetical protein [Halorhodospira abdelmalekii]
MGVLLAALPVPGIAASALQEGGEASAYNGVLHRAALIIDDVGETLHNGRRAVDLPGEVTIAVLPHTPYGRELAERAQQRGREVMLHLPMEAKNRANPGPGAVLLDMDEEEVRAAVRAALADVPHVRGVNNHMGSLVTRHPGHMQWVMEELAAAGDLYFIDSRTSARTVAQRIAAEQRLKNSARAYFLDPVRDGEVIDLQIQQFIAAAQREEGVIAIGHPYPETLERLERILPKLAQKGIELVPASALVDYPPKDPVEEMEP